MAKLFSASRDMKPVVVVGLLGLTCLFCCCFGNSVDAAAPLPARNVFDDIFDNVYNSPEVAELEKSAAPTFPPKFPTPPPRSIDEVNGENLKRVYKKYDEALKAEKTSNILFNSFLGTSGAGSLGGLISAGLALHSSGVDPDIEPSVRHEKRAAKVLALLTLLTFAASAGTGIGHWVMNRKANDLRKQLHRAVNVLNQVNRLDRISKGLERPHKNQNVEKSETDGAKDGHQPADDGHQDNADGLQENADGHQDNADGHQDAQHAANGHQDAQHAADGHQDDVEDHYDGFGGH